MAKYPNLVAEMARADISIKDISACINVCERTTRYKMNGRTPFSWPEVRAIHQRFFPDIQLDVLFASGDERDSA